MRAPDRTPAQRAHDAHVFALANGTSCLAGCPHCMAAPRNRRALRALVTELLRGSYATRDMPRRGGR
jgi:hypothetical protein